jgi:Arm DNA-binding domain
MPLTDAALGNVKPGARPIKLTDGGSLYLEVRPTGAKLWGYRYGIAGKENLFAIDDYPNVSLADARERRAGSMPDCDTTQAGQ